MGWWKNPAISKADITPWLLGKPTHLLFVFAFQSWQQVTHETKNNTVARKTPVTLNPKPPEVGFPYHHPQTKLQKGNVFTSMCQEFCPQGGAVQLPGQTLHRQTPPLGRYPPKQTPPRQTSPWADTPLRQTATAAGGTHPTGMHSCLIMWTNLRHQICSYFTGFMDFIPEKKNEVPATHRMFAHVSIKFPWRIACSLTWV